MHLAGLSYKTELFTSSALDSHRRGHFVGELGSSSPLMRFGEFELDQHSGELRRQGTKVRLQDQLFLGALGYCYAKASRHNDALKVLERMCALAKQHYISGYWQAATYGALGQSI